MWTNTVIVRKINHAVINNNANVYETLDEDFSSCWVIDKLGAVEYNNLYGDKLTGNTGRVDLLSKNGKYGVIKF